MPTAGFEPTISASERPQTWDRQLDTVKVNEIGSLRRLGHLFRMQELTVLKLEATRHVGKRNFRCFESAEENLQNMCVRNWRRQ